MVVYASGQQLLTTAFLHQYNKTEVAGDDKERSARIKGASKPCRDDSPRSVKMRNEEGTAYTMPGGRVGGYCSVERSEISRERSLPERAQPASTAMREMKIVSLDPEWDLEDPE